MKLFLMVVMCLCASSYAAPQNLHQLSPEQQLGTLVTVIDRNVDARIELILQLLQIWRNSRQGISGSNAPINIAPLPYQPQRGQGQQGKGHGHSHGSNQAIPHHGHSHGHDDDDSHEDHDHSHEDHSHEDDVDLQGADPEHKPGEVIKENFEKGVVQVDKKPIVPIVGHDHRK